MRAATAEGTDRQQQLAWSDFLLKIGDGFEKYNDSCDTVLLPGIHVPFDLTLSEEIMTDTKENLLDFVYGAGEPCQDGNRAILAPKNVTIDHLNELLLDRMTTEERTYLSTDIIRPKES